MKRIAVLVFTLAACEDVPTASRASPEVVDVESLARDLRTDPLLRAIADQLRIHEVALTSDDSTASSDSTSNVPTEADILQGVLDLSDQTVNALLRAR
jgi:hypothetical protein